MGTLLDGCTHEMSVRHGSFNVEEQSLTSTCHSGRVTAILSYHKHGNSNRHYSRLTVSREADSGSLNSSTVICGHDDGTAVNTVGSWMLTGNYIY